LAGLDRQVGEEAVAHLKRQLANREIRIDNPSPVRGPRMAKRPASWWELHTTFGPRPWTLLAGIDPIWSKLAVGLGLWLVWSLLLGSQWAWSQTVTVPQSSSKTTADRSSETPFVDATAEVIRLSPASPDVSSPAAVQAASATLPKRPPGSTFLPLENGLDRLFQGQEPRSVGELMALQKQQAKVAEKIQKVTVNVQQGMAQGSGVLVTADGYVLTAAHVAGKPMRDAWVTLSDGKRLRARTLGMNRHMDAGLVKIVDFAGLPHASLGSSTDLREGQWCIAAGHPGGWQSNRPPVIRVGRLLENLSTTLITDCPLIGGDSGGPLFDLEGKLIGIHSRIGSDIQDNMHVPIDIYRDHWDRMADGDAWGTLPGYKPVIGVLGKKDDPAPIIETVVEGSPAEKAGLEAGDRIRKFQGAAIETFQDLILAVEGTMPGDRVRVELLRGDRVMEVTIIVGVHHP
jgi:S1-C subfamily serine protease